MASSCIACSSSRAPGFLEWSSLRAIIIFGSISRAAIFLRFSYGCGETLTSGHGGSIFWHHAPALKFSQEKGKKMRLTNSLCQWQYQWSAAAYEYLSTRNSSELDEDRHKRSEDPHPGIPINNPHQKSHPWSPPLIPSIQGYDDLETSQRNSMLFTCGVCQNWLRHSPCGHAADHGQVCILALI